MTEHLALADEIQQFLDKHAKRSPEFDPAYDEPADAFTGPDPAMLYHAAEYIRTGEDFRMPWSEWGSGCYAPMNDREAQAWHDSLLSRIKDFLELRNTPSSKP